MLVEMQTFLFEEVGDLTISRMKELCALDFAVKLKNEIAADPSFDYSIQHYESFKKYTHTIKFNSKNISFEDIDYDILRKQCEDIYNLTPLYSGGTNEPSIITGYKLENLDTSSEKSREEVSIDLTNFHKYFGVGEFPAMHFYIVRIGNQDYFFYTITR